MSEEILNQSLDTTLKFSPSSVVDSSILPVIVPDVSSTASPLLAETQLLESNQPTAQLNSASLIPLPVNVQSAVDNTVQGLTAIAAASDPLLGTPLVINDSDLSTSSEQNRVQYSGRWNVSSDANAYQQDNHWTDDVNATYQVRFNGAQIKLFGSKTPWHGLAGIRIDSGAEILIDTFSNSVVNNTLLYQSSVLADGDHTLIVRVTGQKNAQSTGFNLLLDQLEVYGAKVQTNPLPPIVSSVIIDDKDLGTGVNKVQYSGIWNVGVSSDNYGGTSHWTNDTGATFQTQFYGSQVKLFGAKAPWHGVTAISLDGGNQFLVDTYAPGFQNTLLYANTGLAEGLHTVRIRTTGQRNINATNTNLLFDRLEVGSTIANIVTPTPQIISTISIDDSDVGTGLNKVQYTGNWGLGQSIDAFNGNNSWTNEIGATYTARFSGSQIKLFGARAPWHGVAAISIDGGVETFVDTYSSGFHNNNLLYVNSTLTQGEHTIRVRVTGQQTASATDHYLLLDRLEVTTTDSNVIIPTSSFLNFSPYTWLPVGDAAQTSNAGAYIKFRFNGSQAILNVDTSDQTSYPLLDVFVDGHQTGSELWLKNTANGQVQIFSGAAGEHDAVVYFRRREFLDGTNPAAVALRQNDWSTDAQHLRVTGITIDGGTGFLANPFAQDKRAVFFGDSITEGGVQSYGPAPDRPPNFFDVNIPQSMSYKTYAARLGDLLGVDYGQVGWSGSGWLRPTTPTGEPPFLQTWLKYNGQSSTTRNFNPPPDYVFVNLGTNDHPFNSSENNINFNVTDTAYNWLISARQQIPGAEIFVIFPFNQTKNSELQAAVTRYRNDFPTDAKVQILDLGAEGACGLQANGPYLPDLAIDQVHPTVNRHQELAGLLFDRIQPLIGSPISVINDSDTASGTRLNTVVYNGLWQRQFQANAVGQDRHAANTTDDNLQITFRGSTVQLYGAKSAQSGIAGISIDGGAEILVDAFNSSFLSNALLYQNSTLSNGFHTINVRVTGQRNASATGNFLLFDRLEVFS